MFRLLAKNKDEALPASPSSWTIVGKVCLVTGANSGIGKLTALELARKGAKRVILACRNVERGEKAVRDIRLQIEAENPATTCELVVLQIDLSSVASVRAFASNILTTEPQLDVLVNNAGVLQGDDDYQVTKDGFEVTFQTNFLGPFLLTTLLLPLIKKSPSARIVNVSSQAFLATWPKGFRIDDVNQANYMRKHGGKFNYWIAYCQSKLAIILYTRYLHRKLSGDISVFSLHPGEVRTNITRNHSTNFIKLWLKLFGTDSEKGAATVTSYCACTPGIEHLSGKYFDEHLKVRSVHAIGKDEAKADQLVQRCLQWTGQDNDGTALNAHTISFF